MDSRMKTLEATVNGERGNYGLTLKVDILWKILTGCVVSVCGWIGIKASNFLTKI